MLQLAQTWDNRHFFQGTDDPQIATAIAEIRETIAEISAACAPFKQRIATAETLDEQDFPPLLAALREIHQLRTALAKQLGNSEVERHIQPEELAKTQEVFLTGTTCEIESVSQIDRQMFEPFGPVTMRLIKAYGDFVMEQTAAGV